MFDRSRDRHDFKEIETSLSRRDIPARPCAGARRPDGSSPTGAALVAITMLVPTAHAQVQPAISSGGTYPTGASPISSPSVQYPSAIAAPASSPQPVPFGVPALPLGNQVFPYSGSPSFASSASATGTPSMRDLFAGTLSTLIQGAGEKVILTITDGIAGSISGWFQHKQGAPGAGYPPGAPATPPSGYGYIPPNTSAAWPSSTTIPGLSASMYTATPPTYGAPYSAPSTNVSGAAYPGAASPSGTSTYPSAIPSFGSSAYGGSPPAQSASTFGSNFGATGPTVPTPYSNVSVGGAAAPAPAPVNPLGMGAPSSFGVSVGFGSPNSPYPAQASASSTTQAATASGIYGQGQSSNSLMVTASATPSPGAIFAGIAYEVHLLGAGGSSTTVDPVSYAFRSGDRFVVLLRPSLPGRLEIYNVNPVGVRTRIDAAPTAAGQLTTLGPYEFASTTGEESLQLLLFPCSSADLLSNTRDIVNVGAQAQSGAGLSLPACASGGARSIGDTGTRDIRKVAIEAGTTYALDPVSQAEVASAKISPRQVSINFHHY